MTKNKLRVRGRLGREMFSAFWNNNDAVLNNNALTIIRERRNR